MRLQLSEPLNPRADDPIYVYKAGWKAIQKFSHDDSHQWCGNSSTVVSLEDESNDTASVDIAVGIFSVNLLSFDWALSKEDSVIPSSPRRPAYIIHNPEAMKPGCAYKFTFSDPYPDG